MTTPTENSPFALVVPLDASAIPDFKPERGLKVSAVNSAGKTVASSTLQLGDKGQAEVALHFDEAPGTLRVLIGPDDASDEELIGLQTLGVTVAASMWQEKQLRLPPVVITPYYWRFWLRWCNTYTVHGRVLCADGSPVPGATVCAFDVDSWWWWASYQNVGCATTDASGSFSLKFRWCCGWWPWWWWRLRDWRLDLDLAERIRETLVREPRLPIPPRPTVTPSLDVFKLLLGDTKLPAPGVTAPRLQPRTALKTSIDTSQITPLRDRLIKLLPASPEFEKLQVWPWFPTEPWWDCQPDLAFRVTQTCRGEERLILNEPWWRTRWNVATTLDVTLTANDNACCLAPPDPGPDGDCLLVSSVCGIQVDDIGGNLGAPAAPAGFAHAGGGQPGSDAPWAGLVSIEGQFGSTAGVDYYEFEVSPTGADPSAPPNSSGWAPVVLPSAGGFSRSYWDGALPFKPADFSFHMLDGHYVVESREHFEANNFPGEWGTTHLWTAANYFTLMNWLTEGHYDNGEQHLRLVGYTRVGDTLTNPRVMPLCGSENQDPPTPNHTVLYLDNRTVVADEPRADVVDVRINGVTAGPCSNIDAKNGGVLEIDFIAYDVDGHLAEYDLAATYGKNLSVNLLGLLASGATLTGVAIGAVPAAVQVGPTYPVALGQGATAPVWSGGGLRLHVPDLRLAFPETCCYQIELHVYKRTIADCDGNWPHRAFSFYSLTVAV